MKLSELTINSIKEYVSGDNGLTPRLSGPKILKLFNLVGFKDIYKPNEGGMPNSVSRNTYVFDRMMEINGTKEMKKLLEIIVDPRHFGNSSPGDIDKAIEGLNPLLQQDGFRYEKIEGQYKIVGANLPDEIEVEIHFAEIQKKIIEQLSRAKFMIWIAVAWFTDQKLFDVLISKKKEGVNIQVIIMGDEINDEHGFHHEEYFETYRRKPTGLYENIMHHKFCIIDLKTVIHGSYNWTSKARYNRETITIDDSREIAEKFAAEFIKLKNG